MATPTEVIIDDGPPVALGAPGVAGCGAVIDAYAAALFAGGDEGGDAFGVEATARLVGLGALYKDFSNPKSTVRNRLYARSA
jgi:hypothetical protein